MREPEFEGRVAICLALGSVLAPGALAVTTGGARRTEGGTTEGTVGLARGALAARAGDDAVPALLDAGVARPEDALALSLGSAFAPSANEPPAVASPSRRAVGLRSSSYNVTPPSTSAPAKMTARASAFGRFG